MLVTKQRGCPHAAVKVYAAATSSDMSALSSPLRETFLTGGLGDNAEMRVTTPMGYLLPLVCDSYEPLEHSSLLSFKAALLPALTSAKRVSELCALSSPELFAASW